MDKQKLTRASGAVHRGSGGHVDETRAQVAEIPRTTRRAC